MTTPITRLEPLAPAGPQPAAAATASPEFRRILERLQQLSLPAAARAADAEQLQDALQRADDHFADAMELRRKLEAAFRARLP